MSRVDDARMMLTQCRICFGCNRQEQDGFRGDDACKAYRSALTDVQKGLSTYYTTIEVGHISGSRQSFTVQNTQQEGTVQNTERGKSNA